MQLQAYLIDEKEEQGINVVALDAEWFVPTNERGIPCGPPDKIALIHIVI